MATAVLALSQMPGSPERGKAELTSVANDTSVTFSEMEISQIVGEACILTGCGPAELHPLILAYAAEMDRTQLEAARMAQVRLVDRSLTELKAASPGSNAADLAHIELAAAARIARYYTLKLHAAR